MDRLERAEAALAVAMEHIREANLAIGTNNWPQAFGILNPFLCDPESATIAMQKRMELDRAVVEAAKKLDSAICEFGVEDHLSISDNWQVMHDVLAALEGKE